ncbi:MAG TPA: DUF447 family protein [Candidatus Altiarchaeales archaeon]|nr:DUF447 family protein [Candidatus Altiarchaeales archaeon]
MRIPANLNLKKGWIYECIVTTYGNGRENAAPIGITTQDMETIIMDIYKDTETCRNILKNKEFVINIISNVDAFHESILEEEKLEYIKSKNVNAPILRNSNSYLEMTVINAENSDDRIRFTSEIVNLRIRGDIRLINRAECIVLESLIIATKLPYVTGERWEFLKENLEENYRIICRIAPNSKFQKFIEKLIHEYRLL